MSRLIKTYNKVKFKSALISYSGDKRLSRDALVGDIGELSIFESEHNEPGKRFVVFITDFNFLRTSLGEVEEGNSSVKVYTHDKQNVYTFDIN